MAVAAALVVLGGSSASASTVPLPAPADPTLLPGIGATADRLRVSLLPPGATADDDEAVSVGLSGDGSPAAVTVDQRIALTGSGDYVVVERGPARRAEVLGDGDPPTLKAGAVLYAGFLPPTGRLLAAHLTLDPAYEAARLPMTVRLSFRSHGQTRPLAAGGRVTGAGVLDVTVTSGASTIAMLAAADAPATAVAGPLDLLRVAASHPGDRPPVVGLGLPASLPGTGAVDESVTTVPAPVAVTGSITETDAAGHRIATLSGPGVTGGTVHGILASTATFSLAVPAAGLISLSLQAVPALDPRTLAPPGGASTWAAWAATSPGEPARRAAVDQLEFAAAESAQIRTVSPYLTTGLVGVVHTRFAFHLAPPATASTATASPLHPRPLGIALLVGGGLLVALGLEFARRRL